MKFSTNKEKGNTALGMAISYFVAQGYIISIPLNDTQDYDLVVEMDGKLNKVQVKATGQVSRYGIPVLNLRSLGGTKGKTYKTVKETEVDLVFAFNQNRTMWLIPKKEIYQSSTISLGRRMEKYRIN